MEIKDKDLAGRGKEQMEWARRTMPVLAAIEERFAREQPLKDLRLSACLHVTKETGVLMQTLAAGGAQVRLCASNPLSTQDEVAASLAMHDGIEVFAIKGVGQEDYYRHLRMALEHKPHITIDDGADLVNWLHMKGRELLGDIKGGTEETTTGVNRLRSMAREGVLEYPVIAVNDAKTKHFFDNRYGTGQSTLDGIMRATQCLMSGSVFVVAGYGWCGRGVAMRAAGMGARVIVTEIDPFRALEAVMDGYQVMTMQEAAAVGDIFCTVTGNQHVIDRSHLEVMKDGAIVCNSGHFDIEIHLGALEALSVEKKSPRDSLETYRLVDGRTICLLGEGRLVNLAAAEGHPPMVMDMSFANQALSAEFIAKSSGSLQNKVYTVPEEIDRQVAETKLKTMGVSIDTLTPAQKDYLRAWSIGT